MSGDIKMAALNWNDLSETPPNAVNWDELSDTPPKETSVPERVVNTGQALGRLAKDLPTHSLAYAANIKEGSRPLDKNDWADKATEDSSKLLNERLSASDANDKTLLGTKGDWAQTGASIPFSMGSIPAAIGAGGLATVVTKNPIAGYSAGATASGALAYRADSAMFMNSALNTFKDKYKAKNNGVEPSQELMLAEQERLQPYAEDHGLWEAIPEGLGSAIGGKVVSSAFKNAGENLAVKAGKVIAGIAAEEMPSETVTEHGQHNTEIDAGVSEGEKRSFTSPSDIAQSVSEVAIPVAQQSLLMGGATGVTSKAYDYAKERVRKLQETAKTGTLGRSIAAGDIAATDTVIQPDIEEKYAAPKANPAEQIENVDTEPAFEKRNSPYNDLFDAATIKHNLPDGLLNKIGHVESGFNPDAISPTGARGVMQFMPRTANEYGIDPHDTPAAIDAAGKKMAHLRDYYDGNITKAIAAYNYGEGNLNEVIDNHGDQWREHLPTETTNYLNKIIGGSNESKSSRVDSGSRSTNDALATTVNKIKEEEEPDYSSLSLDELENLHKKAIDANNDIDYEAIKKHLGEDEADNFLKLSERQKGNWWEKNADTAMEDDSSAFHGIDSDKILAHINAKNDFDIESPESLGRSIAFKMMNISSPDFKGSPDHTAIKSALEYAQDKGWDTQKIIKSARNKATEIAGADAPELFDTLFKKVENKANSEPIIKEQPKAIADQVTPIQLKENKLKSANDEKVEVKYGKNTFHVLKSELDSDAPILAAFNVKSGKQASFKLKRDKIELKDDQPTTITGNDAANGSDAERANGATDTGGATQESNKGLTNPAQAATQPTETINGSKESTNEKRSLPTQEQERPLLNNEAPVQSGALSSGEFNPILKTKKTTWVKNRLKELQVKEGTAGYAKRLKEVQAEHANELEKAQASLPYEQFKALPDNEGIPDSLVRQAYDVLREDHGITTPIDTQAHESATSPNNDLPAPTPAQIEAGNYKKGHINLHGLDISIENPKGSTRSGTDKDGTPWENTMTSHYGYIKGSIGADKEHVDVFVGDNYGSDKAFVVNQNHPHNGKFDEHKVMLGFDTAEQAKEGYLKNYVDGWKGLGSITEIPVSELKDRIKSGALTKPIANSIAKTDESNGVSNKNDQFGEADLPKFIQNIDKHRRDLFGVDDHINKANTLLPFTESTIGDHPSIEHAVDFLNRRTDAYKHFDGRLLKGGSASQSLSLKDDLLPNWSQAKQIERSFEEWKKKYPGQAQKLKENLQNVLNLNKGDKVLFPNHGAKVGDPIHDTGEILKKNPKNWIIKSKNGVELHFQPSALKPVVEDSQVDNSRLEKKSDQKPETKQYHPAIESLSNDLVEGGGVSLIHNEHGTIIGRTPSLNPDWFKDGRFQIYKPDGAPYSSTPSVREVKQAVSDYKAGNKLKAKQVAILESLHDHLVSEEEANSNKKEEDLIYNHLEKEIESGNLTIDDVEEALDEFDNGVPFDVKGGNISINELEDWLGISNEKEESTGSTDKAQGEILQNYSESELAKHEREQADRARKSAEAEVKANQSNYGKANKVFTEGAANAARERLKAKLGRLNSGFDPEMMLDGMTLAGYHIEAGAKQYSAYAKAMIADLGEGIKPYLAHFYNAVRDYPGFDNKDMASYASLEASKKIGVYPGENWRYKNQQAREVTQVNEHYITFATRDNDGRDQESISNFIASKKDWSQTDNTHGQADNDYVKNGSNPQETHHDHSEANNTGTTENITRDSSEAPIESGVSNSQSKKPNQNGTRQSKSRVRTRQEQYDSTDLNQSEGNGLLSEHEGLVGHETNESIERSIGGQTSADTGVSKSIGADNYSLLNKKPIALTPAKRRDVNILAEEILKKPVNEITEDDKNILRQYTGNGGLDVKASADKGEAIFNQHYSAYDTIKAMYGALMDAGIKMVNNLEPSVGSGNFIGMHPRANWTSVDIDKTNTEIVKRLYPDAKVFHESYETFRGKNYDLIISNVPFASFSSLAREHAGTIKPMFKAIHNFFFAQSIDKLKTGGVMAFMTSTGTMDGIGEGQRLRQHLVKHMDVIGAYRLPMGTQKANASTEVMIDVIFLQKRPEGVESKQPEKNNAFVNVTNKGGYKINQYFVDYPESVLGELSVGANKTSMGKVGWIVTGDADYSRMKVEPQDYASTKKATQDRFAGPEEAAQYAEKQGLKFIDGKTTPFFKDGFVYDQPATYSEFSGGGLFGRKATGVNADKMAALQKIEETTDSDLVRSYENKYGKPPHTDKLLELWAKTNHAAKQLKSYLSLFDKHFNLSEIFTKKVRFENSGKIEINENSPLYDRAESLEDTDGIFSTKNNLLSDDEMQGLLDSNDYAKLSNGHFQNARLYYAGNIYQKLDDVQKVKPATQRDKQIARLERVKPTLILIKDLTITGKEKWMPDSAIAAIGKQTYQDGTVIIGDRAIDNNYFLHLFNQYLNNEPLVKKRQGDTPEEYAEQLKAAQNTLYSEVLPLIKQKLMDEGLSDEVVNAYNRAKNFFAPPSFDGSSLRNLPKTFRGKPFKLMRHQLEGAERAIYNKKGVLAFSPGLGKTPTAIVVADQLLQKGVMKKPLFIVPANTIPQWEATTRDLYPNAKVYEFPKYTSGINKGKPKDWPSMSAADKEKMVHDLTNNQYDYTFISTNLAQKITIPTDKLSQYVDDLAESISGMEKPDEELLRTLSHDS